MMLKQEDCPTWAQSVEKPTAKVLPFRVIDGDKKDGPPVE
jgi:hypothetical protein